jgi:hypothetical protein
MESSAKALIISVAVTAAAIVNSHAQEAPKTPTSSKFRISVGPEAGIPIGSFGDRYDWSFGGSVQGEYSIINNSLSVILNAGFSNVFGSNGVEDLQLIPVRAGLRWYPVNKFYLQGDAGVSFIANKNDLPGSKSASFVYAPQLGTLIGLGGKNYLDAGIRFEGNSKFYNSGSSNNQLALRIAYSFGL